MFPIQKSIFFSLLINSKNIFVKVGKKKRGKKQKKIIPENRVVAVDVARNDGDEAKRLKIDLYSCR